MLELEEAQRQMDTMKYLHAQQQRANEERQLIQQSTNQLPGMQSVPSDEDEIYSSDEQQHQHHNEPNAMQKHTSTGTMVVNGTDRSSGVPIRYQDIKSNSTISRGNSPIGYNEEITVTDNRMKEIDVMNIISSKPNDDDDDDQSITQLSTISPQLRSIKNAKENSNLSRVNIEHNQTDSMQMHNMNIKSAATPLSGTGITFFLPLIHPIHFIIMPFQSRYIEKYSV